MNRQAGISSLLATAASLLVAGGVVLGSVAPVSAGTEEDAAAPQGSFVSTMPIPASRGNIVYVGSRSAALPASEEDTEVPPGSFTSSMAVPQDRAHEIKLAGDLNRDNSRAVK